MQQELNIDVIYSGKFFAGAHFRYLALEPSADNYLRFNARKPHPPIACM